MPNVHIERIERQEAASADIVVRNCEKPLHLGDTFDEMVSFAMARTREDFAKPPKIMTRQTMALKVVKIRWHQRDVEEVDPGHVCLVTVEGEGLSLLQPFHGLRGSVA
jgi:hypothetical protein